MSRKNIPPDSSENTASVVIELGDVLAASDRDSSPEAQEKVMQQLESAGWNVTGQQEEGRGKVRRVIGKKEEMTVLLLSIDE